MKAGILILSTWLGAAALPQDTDPSHVPLLAQLRHHVEAHYPERDFSDFLFVSVPRQRMYRVSGWIFRRSYVISTALEGVGSQAGSLRTPLGLHEVCEKYGREVPLGGILKARRFTGRIAEIQKGPVDSESDDVTTRILWLCGLEAGRNRGGDVDSHTRFIYIHGTPEEGLLGQPASEGCIRMRNTEVSELFDQADIGLPVLILEL